jgi:hypothetical protein
MESNVMELSGPRDQLSEKMEEEHETGRLGSHTPSGKEPGYRRRSTFHEIAFIVTICEGAG